MQPQLFQGRIEIMPRGQGKAVNRARPLLPQVHLVDVALEYLVLVVVQLQQYRHHHLGEFAHDGALRCQVIIFHQLLGNGAAAGHHLPGTQITERGPRNAHDGETPVLVKALILHRQQTLAQGLGHIVQPDQHPVFAVGGIDTTDLHRVQPHQVDTLAPGSQALDPVAAQINQYPPRGLALIGESQTRVCIAQSDCDCAPPARGCAACLPCDSPAPPTHRPGHPASSCAPANSSRGRAYTLAGNSHILSINVAVIRASR